MKNINFIIILAIIFQLMQIIKSDDDLYDVSCLSEMECNQFRHPGIKSRCSAELCQCSTSTGEKVDCKPQTRAKNNIIGGSCPCSQPNSECVVDQDICYCERDFMPSNDKRRCIQRIVPLNESCELDRQCQQTDLNAICHPQSKRCLCMKNFVIDEGKCTSAFDIDFSCTMDYECTEKYGVNAKCGEKGQNCICINGHYASHSKSKCLKASKYMETCKETIQCVDAMGLGSICLENVCQCSENYYAEVRQIAQDLLETVCTAKVVRGDYCRSDEDCYQLQLNESQQTLICNLGECNCKKGFNSYNDGECVKASGAGVINFIGLSFILAMALIVNQYF